MRARIIQSRGHGEVMSGESREKSLQSAAIAALRLGDVRKALRIITDAPLAPKDEATFVELQKLHPAGKPPRPHPLFVTPSFSSELVKTALSSFSTGSCRPLWLPPFFVPTMR